MKRKSILLLLLTLMSASLCACTDKGDEEKALYRDNLQKYYDEIYMTSVSINSVDFNSPNAANDFLFYFDTLNASFVNLAAIETPAKYEPFCELTSQASSYISQADTIYHEIYSGENFENFDLEKSNEAYNYYSQAMSILTNIGQSMVADEEANGNIPEESDTNASSNFPSSTEVSSSPAVSSNTSDSADFNNESDSDSNVPEGYENVDYDPNEEEDENYIIIDEDYESTNFGM